MPTPFHERDIRLMLAFPTSTSGTGNRRVDLEAERASDGAPLFRVFLSAEEFAHLMASREVVVRSWVDPGQAFCPNPADHEPPCEENDPDRFGDHNGHVRTYFIIGNGSVAGKLGGRTVALCAAHAQLHGPAIRKTSPPVVLP